MSYVLHFFETFQNTVYWPLPFIIWPPFAFAFWGIYIWTRSGERKILFGTASADAPRSNNDYHSWTVINYGTKAARLAAFSTAFLTMPAAEPYRLWLFAAGLAMMFSGSLLRRHCFLLLGRYFTFRVTASDTHAIVKEGIYRTVRHPSYTGGMLYNIGIGCALTNWLSILLLALAIATVYVYRVFVEERALVNAHGDAYRDYMRHTKRFIPFLF